MPEPLIPKHGGYRKLKSFRLAELVYDITARFCDDHVDRRSRTHDQMVQAARSGVQNIVEGSQASGTSKKMELKLTNVARASLEELRRDYEDFLRQRGLERLAPDHAALVRFKLRRCSTPEEFWSWVRAELRRPGNTDGHRQARSRDGTERSVSVGAGRCRSLSAAGLAANGALSLLNICCWLLDSQIAAQAAAFEREGGFTERLYRIRAERRRNR